MVTRLRYGLRLAVTAVGLVLAMAGVVALVTPGPGAAPHLVAPIVLAAPEATVPAPGAAPTRADRDPAIPRSGVTTATTRAADVAGPPPPAATRPAPSRARPPSPPTRRRPAPEPPTPRVPAARQAATSPGATDGDRGPAAMPATTTAPGTHTLVGRTSAEGDTRHRRPSTRDREPHGRADDRPGSRPDRRHDARPHEAPGGAGRGDHGDRRPAGAPPRGPAAGTAHGD